MEFPDKSSEAKAKSKQQSLLAKVGAEVTGIKRRQHSDVFIKYIVLHTLFMNL